VLYDGNELGVTPVGVDSLPPAQQVELVFRKTGYRDVTRSVRVPRPGTEASVSVALSMSGDFGSVSITSEPPGAQVIQNGELLAGVVTPVDEHIIQADRKYVFTLKAPGRAPAYVSAMVKPGDRGVPLHAELKAGGSVTVTANIEGRASVVGTRSPYCNKQDLPMRNCPLANGKYKIRIEGTRPWASVDVPVVIRDNEVRQDLRFGFVEAVEGCDIEIRRNRTAHKVAFLEGTHKVSVICGDGAEPKSVSVKVNAERTATVP